MRFRTRFALGSCAILLFGLAANAQDVPGLGGVAPAAPAAAAGPNLFTMLLPPADMRERCRQKLCKCEIVKMLRAGLAPASLATGGLIPVGNCCPAVTKEALAKPADSSEGAAARIKKDVEEAAARREAVRYLGTVDCRYWPEAEEALINALRADRIECVRYEAALQLQRGCCCTKKIAKALTICIEGTDKDGFPAERSCRVQDAAAVALSMCVFEDPTEPKKEEKEPEKKRQARVNPKEFYKDVDETADRGVYDSARKALEKRANVNSTQILSHQHRAASHGLFGMLGLAFDSPPAEPPAAVAGTVREVSTVASNSQSPKRGLLHKLFAPSESEVVLAQSPTPTPTVPTPATATPVNTALPRFPSLATSQPSKLPPVNDVRPVGYGGTSTIVEPPAGFSTASPTALPPVAPRTPAPTPTSSNAPPRNDQGLLGFVIMDDTPRRR